MLAHILGRSLTNTDKQKGNVVRRLLKGCTGIINNSIHEEEGTVNTVGKTAVSLSSTPPASELVVKLVSCSAAVRSMMSSPQSKCV